MKFKERALDFLGFISVCIVGGLLFVFAIAILKNFNLISMQPYNNVTISYPKNLKVENIQDKISLDIQKCEEMLDIANTVNNTTSNAVTFLSIAFGLVVFLGLREISELRKARHELQSECETAKKTSDDLRKENSILNKIIFIRYYINAKDYVLASNLINEITIESTYSIDILNNIYMIKGSVSFSQKQYIESMNYYKKILKNTTNDYERANILRAIGQCWFALENYDKAIAYYSETIEIYESFIYAYNEKARALRRQGKIKEALDVLCIAEKIAPNDEIILYNIACYLSLSNQHKKSMDYLKKLMKINIHSAIDAKYDDDFCNIKNTLEFKNLFNL